MPLSLRDTGLAVDRLWQVDLPVMLGSFALMLPAILIAERRGHVKTVFVGAIALLLLGQLSMPWLLDSSAKIVVFLLIFFTAFNVLEAMLPSLTSRLAPRGAKGTALGIYSSIQFLGTFWRGERRLPVSAIRRTRRFAFDAVLLAAWLLLAFGMRARPILTRAYMRFRRSIANRRALVHPRQPGVREVRLSGERTAYLKVDATGFASNTCYD